MDEGETAGQYSHNGQYASVIFSQSILASREALLVTIAHEACHHILDLSSLTNRQDTEQNERATDLAMYICGFGDIARRGYRIALKNSSSFIHMHLGYLKPQEHDYAWAWVGHHRQLMASGTSPIPQPSERKYKEVLNVFHGDLAKVNRWVRYIQEKHPGLAMTQVYERILDEQFRANR